ncbi:F-box domain-containing protein [Mycena sanguinolenta]|uniref:F-box domain-containing protein n=1 Tax=Mycena sanguinolenta TaxID=230812 RepID=A0A8H6X671_9AGAR|nr:F-box domain-containing protein [Mycena sanguinolenta]
MSVFHSRFTNRLNTNYVPSPSEILEIRALLEGPTEEIARIDAQIEEMELALTQLRDKRALLQRPIDAHRALISPMRLIPQDVLLEIFFSCLPSEHNALIDPTEAPLLLGRISAGIGEA